jgi:hypothetical protein
MMYLTLKNVCDGINGVTFLEMLGKGMIEKAGFRLIFVVLESSIELMRAWKEEDEKD